MPVNDAYADDQNEATAVRIIWYSILHSQKLLFDGYLRISILNHLHHSIHSWVPQDIIKLCLDYYLIDIKPLSIRAVYSSIKVFIDYKEYFIARKICESLLSYDPTNDQYCGIYGKVLLDCGLYKDSFEQFSKALIFESCEPDYSLGCAVCCKNLRDFDNAYTYYTDAIAIDNDVHQKYYNHFAQFLRLYKEELGTATRYFMKAMRIEPTNSNSYYQYAIMLRDNDRDYVEAEKYFLYALQICGELEVINNEYGYLLYLMGKYQDAMECFEIALEADDENIWAHFYYGLFNQTCTFDGGERANKRLETAVKLVMEQHKEYDVLANLKVMKRSDPLNTDYYERFEKLINENGSVTRDYIKKNDQNV